MPINFLKKLIYLFIFSCAGSLMLSMGFPLVASSVGYSLVAERGFLMVGASLGADHRL